MMCKNEAAARNQLLMRGRRAFYKGPRFGRGFTAVYTPKCVEEKLLC